jgi:hypothetical protein
MLSIKIERDRMMGCQGRMEGNKVDRNMDNSLKRGRRENDLA